MSNKNQELLVYIHNDSKVKELLLQGADPDTRSTATRATALMLAAKIKQGDVCKTLIEAGANMLAVDMDGRNVLHYAVLEYQSNSSWESGGLVRYLLTKPNDLLISRDKRGETALDYALKQTSKIAAATIFVHGLITGDEDWEIHLLPYGQKIPVELVESEFIFLHSLMNPEQQNKFIAALLSTDQNGKPNTPLSRYTHRAKLGDETLASLWKPEPQEKKPTEALLRHSQKKKTPTSDENLIKELQARVAELEAQLKALKTGHRAASKL